MKPFENEITNFYSIPIGYVSKYKFSVEKKEHHLLDLLTKDQRKFKFRFDSAFSHQRATDAMSRHCEINKHRDLFAFDHAKKLKEEQLNPSDYVSINDRELVDIVMRDYERMGVTSGEGLNLFKRVEMDEMTRIKRGIDLPASVYIPAGLGEDDHLKCAYSRTKGRFPTLAYYSKQRGY